MVDIDMTAPDRDLNPGVDLWEVMGCEVGVSGGGDKKLSVKFFRVANPAQHMYDTIMLAGGGWSIGKQKLLGLGVPEGYKGSIDPLDFIGRRLWLSTMVEAYKGKDRLKVDIDSLAHAGYQQADRVPPGCVAPEEPAADEVPF